MPTEVASIRREHVESFVADLLARRAPATAHNRFRGCQAFFAWLLEEGEVKVSPMARMKPPRLPEAPVPVLRDAELHRLLDACIRDKSFAGRRDEAILRILMDSGIRRPELLGLALGDVDLDAGVLTVTGKGSRTGVVAFGASNAQAIDRYLRARTRYIDERMREERVSASDEPKHLWIGRKGALGATGLAELLRSRARQAGLPGRLYPHAGLNHAHVAGAPIGGGNAEQVMRILGSERSRSLPTKWRGSTATITAAPHGQLDEEAALPTLAGGQRLAPKKHRTEQQEQAGDPARVVNSPHGSILEPRKRRFDTHGAPPSSNPLGQAAEER